MTRAATKTKVSRRKFLVSGAAAGGGLALGVNVPGLGDALAQGVLGARRQRGRRLGRSSSPTRT